MTAAQMVRQRRREWSELEAMLLRLGGRRRRQRATPAELERFAALFRSVCADLARARALDFPEQLIDYLNALAARGHNIFYAAPPVRRGRLRHFFAVGFPLALRRNSVYFAVGLLLFFAPMTAMIGVAAFDEDVLYQIVPRAALESAERMYQRGHQQGRGEGADLGMTGFYIRNNIGIAFQCFATGIFFGLGSVFFLLYNGVLIGAVVGFVGNTPSAMNLLSFIVGHGPFELTAIAIAGAAGLRIGFGALAAGSRSRWQALRESTGEAVQLVLGAAALLLGAALIEGFFSPSSLPMVIKFAFGGCCALFLVWYLGVFAWQVERRAAAPARGGQR